MTFVKGTIPWTQKLMLITFHHTLRFSSSSMLGHKSTVLESMSIFSSLCIHIIPESSPSSISCLTFEINCMLHPISLLNFNYIVKHAPETNTTLFCFSPLFKCGTLICFHYKKLCLILWVSIVSYVDYGRCNYLSWYLVCKVICFHYEKLCLIWWVSIVTWSIYYDVDYGRHNYLSWYLVCKVILTCCIYYPLVYSLRTYFAWQVALVI